MPTFSFLFCRFYATSMSVDVASVRMNYSVSYQVWVGISLALSHLSCKITLCWNTSLACSYLLTNRYILPFIYLSVCLYICLSSCLSLGVGSVRTNYQVSYQVSVGISLVLSCLSCKITCCVEVSVWFAHICSWTGIYNIVLL